MEQSVLNKIRHHFSGCEPRSFAKGTVLTVAGEDPAGVSLLVDGLVEQYDITPEGNKVAVNIFRPPAFFPMSWAINRAPNNYFFGALTDVKLRQAGADETVNFLRANPDVMMDLLSRVYKGTDALLRRLMLAASGIAAKRLVFELLIEAYRFGTEASDGKILITVRQHVLADRCGLARETVSRELNKLEQAQLIVRSKQGIVLDVRQLEQRLDFIV